MSVAEIRLLGGVDVRRAGVSVPLGGRRLRTLIALLALEAGRTVSIDRLARGIWDDQPPERVRGSLQTYISRLRRLLGDDVVSTEASGYSLRVRREQVDVLRFRDALARAQHSDSTEVELTRLDEALALWRGEPFDEKLSQWIDRFERPGLIEEYLQALERRFELALERGESGDCAVRLGSLVEQHPLRETLWVLLLRALDGAGRTAEALERYETIRRRLASELGTDPGPDLQAMHHRLLVTSHPVSGATDAQPPPRTIPRQLPPVNPAFAGRRDKLEGLDEFANRSYAGSVVAVHGPGGVGKTSLVVAWGHGVVEEFADGQLFVDLRGFGPSEAMSPDVAADLLLRGVGVSGPEVPDELDARAALLRSVLADRRCLIVLDNARDAGQVRPLLPGGPSLVVVTSRSQLRSLTAREGARRLPVRQMDERDAIELLRMRMGAIDRSADLPDPQLPEEQLVELAALCGHLPVALTIVAEQATRHPDGPSGTVAELRAAVSRLDALTTGEDDLTDVRAVLDWTYRELEADAAQMLALLGLYPDNQVCGLAASSLAGLPWSECRKRLDQLAECHLIEPRRDGWYAVHDLVSAFAREVATQELSEQDRHKVTTRLRSWFVRTAENARFVLQGSANRLRDPEPAPCVEPRTFEDRGQAQLWFSRHRVALSTLIAEAESDEDHFTVCGLVNALAVSLEQSGADVEARRLSKRGLAVSERSGDKYLQGVMVNLVGGRLAVMADFEGASEFFVRARECFAECGDWLWWARATSNIAVCLGALGRHRESVALIEEAYRIGVEVGFSDEEQAFSLSRLAASRIIAGDPERGLTEARQAVAVLREIGSGTRLASAHETVASGLARLHRWPEAERALAASIAAALACGAIDKALKHRVEFARMQRREGELDAARLTLERALQEVDQHEAARAYEGASLRAVIYERLEDLRAGSTREWSRM